jgi:hypothetical protein
MTHNEACGTCFVSLVCRTHETHHVLHCKRHKIITLFWATQREVHFASGNRQRDAFRRNMLNALLGPAYDQRSVRYTGRKVPCPTSKPWRSCGLLKCWFKRHSDEGCDVDIQIFLKQNYNS